MQPKESNQSAGAELALDRIRDATRGTEFASNVYLVGGMLRDRALGHPFTNDLDLVVDGDALRLTELLHSKGLSQSYPVLYPRFGTAMIQIARPGEVGAMVELVTARAESYESRSRKPNVRRSSIEDDAYRRDFTINTLMENLDTGELLDLTGRAMEDLRAGIIRTPLEPGVTFYDDPLRMLRAVRFAARFGFAIEEETWRSIQHERARLAPPAIAQERIREEFVKIIGLPGPIARRGMELLLDSGLLEQFLSEMLPMVGCTQNAWHLYDVWVHTLVAIEQVADWAPIGLRLGLLWHDISKPATRTEDDRGAHFYGHQHVGAETVRSIMRRLKFSNDEIVHVSSLVDLHMQLGEYKRAWADAPVKRLIRDAGPYLDELFELARCDIAASNIAAGETADLDGLRQRIADLNAVTNVCSIGSPLDGVEIMELLNVGPGPILKEAKEFLTNEVIEGRILEGDKGAATKTLLSWRTNGSG